MNEVRWGWQDKRTSSEGAAQSVAELAAGG